MHPDFEELGTLDFSHEALKTLDEGTLSEVGYPFGGTILSPRYWVVWTSTDGTPIMADPFITEEVDFDGDGVTDLGLVAVDLDDDGGPPEVHTGAQDWGGANLTLAFQQSADFTDPAGDCGPPDDAIERGLLGLRRPPIDVLPGCTGDPLLPTTAGQVAPAIVYGSLGLDVATIDTDRTRLGGALPTSSALRDVDLDGYDDLVLEFPATGFTLDLAAVRAHIGGYTSTGLRFTRTLDATFAATDPDGDGDGVHDACDACPTDGTAPRGPDGCPW